MSDPLQAGKSNNDSEPRCIPHATCSFLSLCSLILEQTWSPTAYRESCLLQFSALKPKLSFQVELLPQEMSVIKKMKEECRLLYSVPQLCQRKLPHGNKHHQAFLQRLKGLLHVEQGYILIRLHGLDELCSWALILALHARSSAWPGLAQPSLGITCSTWVWSSMHHIQHMGQLRKPWAVPWAEWWGCACQIQPVGRIFDALR